VNNFHRFAAALLLIGAPSAWAESNSALAERPSGAGSAPPAAGGLAQEQIDARTKVIQDREASLRKDLDEDVSSAGHSAGKAEAARVAAAKRAYRARKACEADPLCSKAMVSSVDWDSLKGKQSSADNKPIMDSQTKLRSYQTAESGYYGIKKSRDDLNGRYTELLRNDRCLTGYEEDLRASDGKITESALIDLDATLKRYDSIDTSAAMEAKAVESKSADLDSVIQKMGLQLSDEDIDSEASEYASGAAAVKSKADWGIRKGDSGYDGCKELLGIK
jgi:hypothetical protein